MKKIMKKKNKKNTDDLQIPQKVQVEAELHRVRFKSKYFKMLRSTAYALIVTAAISVLVATLFLPVLQIYGNSMAPTLTEGEISISVKKSEYKPGEIVALYYSNRVLVKRIIACGGDIVSLDENGNFTVNGLPFDEPYLSDKDYGDSTDIDFPYTVPAGTYFVAGDHRKTSIDSRNSSIGCIAKDEMVGKIIFTIWPLGSFGIVK